jgi:branched-chain amino acid transport system ATP-binding protein
MSTAQGTPALSTRGLSLAIGGARLVTDLTLDVAPGELLGVIGPNGAGKTTLFNLLTGILSPTSGQVLLNGRDVTRTAPHARARLGLGRTFQTSSLFPTLSVVENVRLALQARGRGSLSILRRPGRAIDGAREHLASVGLADRGAVAAGSLAHGEQRKLEIALLLAMDPAVVLLDEPMAGVGSGDVDDLTALIGRIGREQGRTVLLVEHHMDVVLGLADRVAVLHHGRLLACDTPKAVMADETVQSAYLGSRSAA